MVELYTPDNKIQNVHTRWLIRRDMPEVLDIESRSFENGWTEEDFLCCLRQRNCIGIVAEHNNNVYGFMIYELHKSRLRMLNFAVDPEVRKQGVSSQMIERLVEKLSQQRRREILTEVRESNLTAQLFYKSQGFKATTVLRNHYDDTNEDKYLMRYKLGSTEDESNVFDPSNRVSQYFDAA